MMMTIKALIFRLVLLIFVCLGHSCIFAQVVYDSVATVDSSWTITPPAEETDIEAEEDSTTTTLTATFKRTAKPESVANLRKDKDFKYMGSIDSILRALQADRQTERKAPAPSESYSFWELPWVKYVFWGLALSAVAFVLFQFFKGDGGMFRGNSRLQQPVQVEAGQRKTDLDALIEKSAQDGDYRLALRYQFLKTLTRLGEKGILQLSTEKTDHQYITELSGKPYAGTFSRISLQYEYVWFGEINITQAQFRQLQQQHLEFLKAI